MKITFAGLCSLLIIGLILPNQRAHAQSFSLKKAVNFAITNHYQVKLSELDKQQVGYQKDELIASALPQISGVGSLDDNLQIQTTLLPSQIFGGKPGEFTAVKFGTQYNVTARIQGEFKLFDQTFWTGLKAIKVSDLYAEKNIRKAKEDVTYMVAAQYYQVVLLEKQLGTLSRNLAENDRLLAQTELKFRNGASRKIDLDRIKVNRNSAIYQIEQARTSLAQAQNNLKYNLGLPAEATITLTDTSLLDVPTGSGLQQWTVNNRTDYQLQEIQVSIAELNRAKNQAGYYPILSATGSYGTQALSNQFDFTDTKKQWYPNSVIGLRLNIPIFDGGQRHYRNQQNLLTATKASTNLNNLKVGISKDVANAQLSYDSKIRSINNERDNLSLAQDILTTTRFEFNNGSATAQDVLTAESSFNTAKNNYFNSLLQLYVSRLDLEKARGTLFTYLQLDTPQQQ
jgi:outer membrane protein TolC